MLDPIFFTPASLVDRALVDINGERVLVATGSTFRLTAEGDLIVAAPAMRAVFDQHSGAEGRVEQPGRTATRLFKRPGPGEPAP